MLALFVTASAMHADKHAQDPQVLAAASNDWLHKNLPSPADFGHGLTIWMFWDKGEKHLKAQTEGKWYGHGHRCVNYWKRLNPKYEVVLLDDIQAASLSPAYKAMKPRGLHVKLMTDVLRLDLLSLYGGVWADVLTCPVTPLKDYLDDMIEPAGFFTFKGDTGNTTNKAGDCIRPKGLENFGALINDNWFLISPAAHNQVVDLWLSSLKDAVAELPDGAIPGEDYEPRFAQCIVNNMYKYNEVFRRAYDTIPSKGYCQHKGNAVDFCPQTADDPDEEPDEHKWMYKGAGALYRMDFDDFEDYIERVEQRVNQAIPHAHHRILRKPKHGLKKRSFLCPNASRTSDFCIQEWSGYLGLHPEKFIKRARERPLPPSPPSPPGLPPGSKRWWGRGKWHWHGGLPFPPPPAPPPPPDPPFLLFTDNARRWITCIILVGAIAYCRHRRNRDLAAAP
jgi:hypothetical protein